MINAPWTFTSIWSIIKRFLDPKTIAKVHILGSDYQKELCQLVDGSSLPKFLGGTCSCPGGCENSDQGNCRLYSHSLKL